MTSTSIRALFDRAVAHGGGVGAFNVILLEHAEALVDQLIGDVGQGGVLHHRGTGPAGSLVLVAPQTPEAGVVAYDELTGELKWKSAPLSGTAPRSSLGLAMPWSSPCRPPPWPRSSLTSHARGRARQS